MTEVNLMWWMLESIICSRNKYFLKKVYPQC